MLEIALWIIGTVVVIIVVYFIIVLAYLAVLLSVAKRAAKSLDRTVTVKPFAPAFSGSHLADIERRAKRAPRYA